MVLKFGCPGRFNGFSIDEEKYLGKAKNLDFVVQPWVEDLFNGPKNDSASGGLLLPTAHPRNYITPASSNDSTTPLPEDPPLPLHSAVADSRSSNPIIGCVLINSTSA